MDTPPTQSQKHAPSARASLSVRRARSRAQARRRIAQATTQGLTAQQKALDPLSHRGSTGQRAGKGLAWLLVALGVHALIVGVGLLTAGKAPPPQRVAQEVKIEVRPPPPPPPEPEIPPVPPADVAAETPPPKPERIPPKPQRLPPAPAPAEPPPPDNKPPPRVVGLSLDSTVEGGEGPSFAVGNTREGATANRAADPNKVAAVGTGPIVAEPTEAPNRAATRIPTVGLVFTPAKRKQPSNPDYPLMLKSQGIEGDVTVMVSISAEGKVTAVKIIKQAAYPEFNEAARRTALAEDFEPAAKNGVPVPTTITFTYRFRLEEP